ncbi:hypothetical protein NM688_g6499 [Phlebia brevispora]|uniref:Uncharacterized protein n=1 Tax=Phlebia brevispora TaxID=194682 RepID=A0ACC1SFP3_9APHY|nr:hypothetical protein NM688_g6499 [Phlebia brevispora]
MTSSRLKPAILPPDFYDILSEDWDVDLRKDSVVLISPASNEYFIGPNLLYSDAYRQILDQGFDLRGGPVPARCPQCNVSGLTLNRGVKPGWEGKHIWSCRGSCSITVPEQLDMPQEQLEQAIAQRHDDVRSAILDVLCRAAEEEADDAPRTPSRKRCKRTGLHSLDSIFGRHSS